MKRKILSLLLVGVLSCSILACGENEKSQSSKVEDTKKEETKKPTDLTGTWKSSENNGTYQEAIISENKIEINWVSDEGKTKSIYWIGTYEAPTEDVDTYSWTSERNKEETDSALLASTDDTKDFNYKDGIISYEASAFGTTTTVELTKE